MLRILFYNTFMKLFEREASVNIWRHKMCNKLENYIRLEFCFSTSVDSARAEHNSLSACHIHPFVFDMYVKRVLCVLLKG
jgi:hypothetical protein